MMFHRSTLCFSLLVYLWTVAGRWIGQNHWPEISTGPGSEGCHGPAIVSFLRSVVGIFVAWKRAWMLHSDYIQNVCFQGTKFVVLVPRNYSKNGWVLSLSMFSDMCMYITSINLVKSLWRSNEQCFIYPLQVKSLFERGINLTNLIKFMLDGIWNPNVKDSNDGQPFTLTVLEEGECGNPRGLMNPSASRPRRITIQTRLWSTWIFAWFHAFKDVVFCWHFKI